MYLEDGSEYNKSEEIFRLAKNFWNHLEVYSSS